MLERWGPDFMDHTLLCGDSAGIVLVLGIALKYTPAFIASTYQATCAAAPGGILRGGMEALAEQCLQRLVDGPGEVPNPDTYRLLNDRVMIGSSTWSKRHVWTRRWQNNEELMASLRQSFHIPLLCRRCDHGVDGAYVFAGTDLPHGDKSFYVGDDGAADVSYRFSLQEMFYPVTGDAYLRLVAQGQQDMLGWNGQLKRKIGVRRPNLVIQSLLWFLKALEWSGCTQKNHKPP